MYLYQGCLVTFPFNEALNPMDNLVTKLKSLKEAVAKWINSKKLSRFQAMFNKIR